MNLVASIQKSAGTAKWVGIFMIIAGILSIASPLAAGLSVTMVAGSMLLVTGIAQMVLAFRSGSFGEGLGIVLLGLLAVLAGGYMLFQPGAAMGVLTLFLAGTFVAQGIVEMLGAFGARPRQGWGWLLFGGIVSLLLGIMIWRQFPISGVWAIGTLVGVRLLMGGTSLTAIGSTVKGVAREVSKA
jgi:uncharacterized membrane protein HdeD (DUF308 family)